MSETDNKKTVKEKCKELFDKFSDELASDIGLFLSNCGDLINVIKNKKKHWKLKSIGKL